MNRLGNMSKDASRKTLEFEHNYLRSVDVGYRSDDSLCFLSCIEHGAPHSLIRWHHHEEYELHFITATQGTMYVGEYIGNFEPGNLVLTGPSLPHNWVSNNIPEEGIPSRDISLQFLDKPIRKACEYLPEMRQILPLLDRAKYGIEFFGISDYAKKQLIKIKNNHGIHSFNEFMILMTVLSSHTDFKLLSNTEFKTQNSNQINEFSDVIDYITKNSHVEFKMIEFAEKTGMEGSKFSRSFKQSVGCTFTDFVNHARINKASQLLAETDKYITTIAYEVGFNTVANFNRRFFERKKMTPKEYRNLSKHVFNN